MIRTINSRLRLGPRLAASASASTSPFHTTGAVVGRRRRQHHYHLLASCSTYHSPHPSRFFWSSSSSAESEEHQSEKKKKNDNPPSALPIPPLTPSNIAATSLLSNSTIESLKSLPEIQSIWIYYTTVSTTEVKTPINNN